jgi:hypothetical protein
LQFIAVVFAQRREHEVALGNAALQVFGKNFDRLPKTKMLIIAHVAMKATPMTVIALTGTA